MMRRRCTQFCLFLSVAYSWISFTEAWAGEISSVSVAHQDNVYELVIEAHIDAPVQSVYALLTDYANLNRVSSSVTESRVIAQLDRHVHRIVLVTQLCVLFYCKDLRQTQDISQYPMRLLVAKLVRQDSDLRSGGARWQLSDADGGTYLLFEASMEPDFWIPPLIGPLVVKHMLYTEAVNTVSGLERLHKEKK